MDYFEIKVQAKSPEELVKRVEDNELRGFEVARYYNYETEGSYGESSKYKRADGINQRHKIHSSSKFYGAVMRRNNRDYPTRVAQ